MNQQISQYSNTPSSKTVVSTHLLEPSVYTAFEKILFKRYQSAHLSKYMFFKNQTALPDECKFPKSPKREIFCAILTMKHVLKVSDIFLDFNTHEQTDNVILHSINRDIVVFIGGAKGPINLQAQSSLKITNGEGRQNKMSFSVSQIPTMLVLEAYYPDIPRRYIDDWCYNVSEEHMDKNLSFLRKEMSMAQTQSTIRFVAAEYVATRDIKNPKQSPVSISISDYKGVLIKNSIITPRETIMHLQGEGHHLTRELILNGWDEFECITSIRKALDQKIIVGINIKKFLDVFQIPTERVLGIRDLSNAPCFD